MKKKFILEGYPYEILLKLKARRISLAKLSKESKKDLKAIKSVFERFRLWNKETLTVSFKGGTRKLHEKIASVAEEWTRYANIKFDFGFDEKKGSYRLWKKNDQSDIRIGFDNTGYWSYIGTEAVDQYVCPPGSITLNLEGFDVELPDDWQRLVLHEFGHALGFHHEHQTPALKCDFDFPKLYTWMKDQYNWSKEMVDENLKQLSGYGYEFSEHDRDSIMHYAFPADYYDAKEASPCYIRSENHKLSDTDKIMAGKAYPFDAKDLRTWEIESDKLLKQFKSSRSILRNEEMNVVPLDFDDPYETLDIRIIRAILECGGFRNVDPDTINPLEEKVEDYIENVGQKNCVCFEMEIIIKEYNPEAEVECEEMEGFELFQDYIDYAAEKI